MCKSSFVWRYVNHVNLNKSKKGHHSSDFVRLSIIKKRLNFFFIEQYIASNCTYEKYSMKRPVDSPPNTLRAVSLSICCIIGKTYHILYIMAFYCV